MGDSISTGYGLDENEPSYCEYLEQYYDAKLDNFAENGRQTSELINQLDSDQEVINSIKEADLICVSIGGNDVLHIFEDALYSLDSSSAPSSGENGQFQISSEFIQQFLMQYSSGFGPAAAQAGDNINTIKEKISDLNSSAPLVFQTIYNPFETDNEALNNIMKPLKTFTAIYLGTINNSIKQQSVVADISSKLHEKSWLFTNINEFDIHPNYLGHMFIAEEIVQKLRISGDYSVFKDAVSAVPETTLSQIPEAMLSEVKNLGEGNLRIEDSVEANKALTAEREEETKEAETSAAVTESHNNTDTETSTKSKISGILFKVGICLVLISLCIKIYSNKRKDKKTK